MRCGNGGLYPAEFSGENCPAGQHCPSLSLLALGLKHFEGTKFPKLLMSKYLLTCKTAHQLTVRIKNLNMNRAPDNIIKVSAWLLPPQLGAPAQPFLPSKSLVLLLRAFLLKIRASQLLRYFLTSRFPLAACLLCLQPS